MHGHRPLIVEMQPHLGHQGTIGVQYSAGGQGAGGSAAPVADRVVPEGTAPSASPEILTRLDQILVEFQQLTQAVYLNAPVADIKARQSLERIACAHEDCVATAHDLHHELQSLRADLYRRTAAARCRRAWAWLKGWFV